MIHKIGVCTPITLSQSGRNAQGGGADSDGDGDGSGSSSVNAANGLGQGHHGIGKMEANLQSLIQQLSSSNSSGSGSTNAALQQSFQNLTGMQGSPATLAGFLQTLSRNMQGAVMYGNMVNTQG